MIKTKLLFGVSLLFLLFTFKVTSQTVNQLPRSTPEAEGVSSEGIINFLDAANKSNHEFHSLMFLRHGKVIAEGWWNPYKPELRHTLYSVSKSFTSTAVGFAVSEGKLKVTDKVISFFPNELPDTVSEYLKELTVKDLLTMSVGQDPDPTSIGTHDTNWVKRFLSTPIINKPGTKFLYNSLGSYTLSAIVQKVTGQKIIDYLRPRLFEPLSIQGIDWEVSPQDVNTGGWGLRIRTEDMAKFGQLYLQKGKWQGKQVIPQKWLKEATTSKIESTPSWVLPGVSKDSSDWLQGYCYQFWRCRNNAFRGDGAYGQFIIVMPDQDAVIIITAETTDMQDEINLIWKYLFQAIQKDKLPTNKNILSTLKQKLSALALPIPVTNPSSFETSISDKIFSIAPNEIHVQTLSLGFEKNICHVNLKTDSGAYTINFGKGLWQTGETNKPGPSLVVQTRANRAFLLPYKIAGGYDWKDKNTLELILDYIETPHSQDVLCHFDQDKISIDIQNSTDKKITTLTGQIK